MGLDMYLARKQRFGGYGNEMSVVKIVPKNGNKEKIVEVKDQYGAVEIEMDIAYWRKANTIHKWFVDNCADGEDNCQPAYVEIEQLRELKALCEKVLKTAKMSKALVNVGSQSGIDENGKVFLADVKKDEKGNIIDFTKGKEIKAEQLADGDYFVYEPTDPRPYEGKIDLMLVDKHSRVYPDYHCFRWGEVMENADVVAEMLPTEGGFFFGSTDYDNYYLEDVEDTIEKLENIIADHEDMVANGVEEYTISYRYQASW